MSVKEYAEYRTTHGNSITVAAVTKAIRKGHRTPGVWDYEMYGGTYILHVDVKELNSFLVAIKKPVKLHSK